MDRSLQTPISADGWLGDSAELCNTAPRRALDESLSADTNICKLRKRNPNARARWVILCRRLACDSAELCNTGRSMGHSLQTPISLDGSWSWLVQRGQSGARKAGAPPLTVWPPLREEVQSEGLACSHLVLARCDESFGGGQGCGGSPAQSVASSSGRGAPKGWRSSVCGRLRWTPALADRGLKKQFSLDHHNGVEGDAVPMSFLRSPSAHLKSVGVRRQRWQQVPMGDAAAKARLRPCRREESCMSAGVELVTYVTHWSCETSKRNPNASVCLMGRSLQRHSLQKAGLGTQ